MSADKIDTYLTQFAQARTQMMEQLRRVLVGQTEVIEQILARKPAAGSLFNVNLPVLERGPIRGVKVLPQNVTPYTEKYDRRVNPRGRTYFWTDPEFNCPEPLPDTDVTALAEGFITVTPLKFDLTDHAQLADLQGWEWTV